MSEYLPLLNYQAAQEAKLAGLQRAIDHAGESWLENAISDFLGYLRAHGEATTEAWRADYLKRGLEPPASHNCWGALVQVASKRKLIRPVGFVLAQSVATHRHPVRIWRLEEG